MITYPTVLTSKPYSDTLVGRGESRAGDTRPGRVADAGFGLRYALVRTDEGDFVV